MTPGQVGGQVGGQSRRGSAVEALANVAAGLLVGWAANLAILPAFGFPVSPGAAAGMSAIYTAISLVRSFALRRLFNSLGARTNVER